MKSYTNHTAIFLAIIFSTLMSSCGSGFYSPINEVAHSTSEKGELVASLNFNQSNAFKLQSSLSYSPIKHVGLSYTNVNGPSLKSNSVALGLYTNSVMRESNKKLFYDFYAGFAQCNNTNLLREYFDFFDRMYKIESKYNKIFFQGGLHTVGKISSFDLVARFSTLDFEKIVVVGDVVKSVEAEVLRNKDPFKIFEVCPKISVGPSQYKINFGLNWMLKGSSYPEFDRVVVYSGVSVNLGKLFKKNPS
jgi:hypothetical protein